jgi:hypothetical protein
MEAFYSRVCQLFTSVINKNEAVINEIEEIKTKCSEMLSQLSNQNDTIIDEVQLFQQNATKEFRMICDDLVSKSTVSSLEQRAYGAEQSANQMLEQQTKYLRQIEDLEFEVKNLKSVSLLSQKDKYNRTLQIEVESLEKKLKASEMKYKVLEERINSSSVEPNVVSPKRIPTPESKKYEYVCTEKTNVSTVCGYSIPSLPSRCYARIGNEKLAADTLTTDEINAYPADVYKSKTGKFIGRPCANYVSNNGSNFCVEHSEGFYDIRLEPPTDGDKPKKKKKAICDNPANTVEPPLANAPEPVANAPEPVANASEPVANTVEPVANAPEPVANTVEPPVANTVEPPKEKKTRKKKTTTEQEQNISTDAININEPGINSSIESEKVKKPRKKKTDEPTPTITNQNTDIQAVEQVPSSQTSTPGSTSAKRGRKKKETPTEQTVEEPTPASQTSTPGSTSAKRGRKKKETPTEQTVEEPTPASQTSTPGSTGAKRGRKKKEPETSPVRTPIVQKPTEYTLKKVDAKVRPSKPDWAFIEPWDTPEGVQYVVDTKTNYVFEATDSGDIGGFTGFMRIKSE